MRGSFLFQINLYVTTELQGRLSDYNLLVDKLNVGTERGEIVAETRDLAAANEVEATSLESMFAERTRRQAQVTQLEQEIQKVFVRFFQQSL